MGMFAPLQLIQLEYYNLVIFLFAVTSRSYSMRRYIETKMYNRKPGLTWLGDIPKGRTFPMHSLRMLSTKLTTSQRSKITKSSNLDQNPSLDHYASFGTNFVSSEDSKNFERSYLKNLKIAKIGKLFQNIAQLLGPKKKIRFFLKKIGGGGFFLPPPLPLPSPHRRLCVA